MKTLLFFIGFLFFTQSEVTEKIVVDGKLIQEEKSEISTIPSSIEIKDVEGAPILTIFHSRSGKLVSQDDIADFPATLSSADYELQNGDHLILVFDRGSDGAKTYQLSF